MSEETLHKDRTALLVLIAAVVIGVLIGGWMILSSSDTHYNGYVNYEASYVEGYQYWEPEPGNIYYDLKTVIKNVDAQEGISTNAYYWDGSTAKVDGVLYKPKTVIMSSINELVKVAPGGTYVFHIVFEIPEGATPEIKVKYNDMTDTKVTIDNTIPIPA